LFTGIVEACSPVVAAKRGPQGMALAVDIGELSEDVRVGDSIAISGCCLTVVELNATVVRFDVAVETLRRTNLGTLREGGLVNVERAMKASDRLGGHLVLGHVDCTGRVVQVAAEGDGKRVRVEFPEKYAPFVVEKGSVALDGVSLTVARCGFNWLEVALIPHTIVVTTLGSWTEGYEPNVEFEAVGKYVVRALEVYKARVGE
jgi:riboflavin synthase